MALMVVMEMLAGFAVLLGLSLPDITSPGDAIIWPLFLCAYCGALAGMAILLYGPGDPWNRIATLTTGIVLAVGVSWLLSSTRPAFVVTSILLAFAYWRGLMATREPPSFEEVQVRFGLGF